MFFCNLCIFLFVCDTALSFIQLPCLTNESRDFSYAKQVLKELDTYMKSQIQQSRNILHNLKYNAGQKIKKAENALTNGIDNSVFWIGLTDLYEGHFRWTFDQSKTTFTKWVSGYGSKGTSNNCVSYNSSNKPEWYDTTCYSSRSFICETNYCLLECPDFTHKESEIVHTLIDEAAKQIGRNIPHTPINVGL
ncbi:unnamed protein product [Mytilus coruscus]|uniref:C-type lectin domain-containing protein n=1 Tax=Mytilus coruscus TaxID=42192 RepID=A0A6J8CYW4_MYTCO|nr:unnamed protein product [Mytilus coruscus]